MTKILIENLGEHLKLSLKAGQDNTSKVLFANLAWVCSDYLKRADTESFIVGRKVLAGAIQGFRIANPSQSRRGKGLWKQSPFSFEIVRSYSSEPLKIQGYKVGSYQDSSNNAWEGYRPSLAKHFDA